MVVMVILSQATVHQSTLGQQLPSSKVRPQQQCETQHLTLDVLLCFGAEYHLPGLPAQLTLLHHWLYILDVSSRIQLKQKNNSWIHRGCLSAFNTLLLPAGLNITGEESFDAHSSLCSAGKHVPSAVWVTKHLGGTLPGYPNHSWRWILPQRRPQRP